MIPFHPKQQCVLYRCHYIATIMQFHKSETYNVVSPWIVLSLRKLIPFSSKRSNSRPTHCLFSTSKKLIASLGIALMYLVVTTEPSTLTAEAKYYINKYSHLFGVLNPSILEPVIYESKPSSLSELNTTINVLSTPYLRLLALIGKDLDKIWYLSRGSRNVFWDSSLVCSNNGFHLLGP